MSTVTKKSYDEQLLDGLREWRKLHPDAKEWNNEEVAKWLIRKHGYELERQLLHKQIAKRLSRAEGKKRVKNQQGKLVSEFHAASFPMAGKKKQQTLWAHRSTMSNSFAQTSFEQRQKQAEGICRAMVRDAEDVNTNNANMIDNPVQLELDFNYVKGQPARRKVQTLPVFDKGFSKEIGKKKPR